MLFIRHTGRRDLSSLQVAVGRCISSSSGGGSSDAAAGSLPLLPLADQLQDAPELGIFAGGAAALDALHAATGLPWWAVIPLQAVAIKTLLLPVSLKQAKIVRTNMVLWTESFEFQRQQLARARHRQQPGSGGVTQPAHQQQQQQQQQQAPAAEQQVLQTAVDALQQMQQWQQRIQVYHDLRRKCSVPHPAWFMVNQLLQWPVFVYPAMAVRTMAQAGWPGFSSGGCLWFSNLAQPAVVFAEAGVQLPMGLQGLLLPLVVTGAMLTSIRLGFRASGAASRHPSIAGTWLSTGLAYLPPLLYCLIIASAYFKLQLPQAAVLHWLASSSYTLGLQLALRQPALRRMLGYNVSSPAGTGGLAGGVDPGVAAQAAAVDNADVLVVMGAKHAALQRYNEALHCLHRALQINPTNARAHYSAGQIHALQHQWQQSEESYRKCARLAADEQARGQALYCVGVATHQQGKYEQALDAYAEASGAESIRPMLVLGQVRALRALGRLAEAAAVKEGFLDAPGGPIPESIRAALEEVQPNPQERP